jgi:hypothetical protein
MAGREEGGVGSGGAMRQVINGGVGYEDARRRKYEEGRTSRCLQRRKGRERRKEKREKSEVERRSRGGKTIGGRRAGISGKEWRKRQVRNGGDRVRA